MFRTQDIPEHTQHFESIAGQTVPATELLLKAVNDRWKTYKRERARCERGRIAGVHEFRVAIRRLMAAIDFLIDLAPDSEVESTRKKLKKQLSRMSALRDLQVQRTALEKFLPEHPGIAPLIEKLHRSEKRKGADITHIATKPKKETLRGALVRLQKNLNVDFGRSNAALLRALMTSSVDAAFRRVIIRRDAMRPAKIATIHDTRLAFKRFRYLLELLYGILPEVSDTMLTESRKVQSCMGAIHDTEVLMETMNEFKWKGSAPVADSMRVKRELKACRRKTIEELMTTAKRIDALWNAPESPTL